MADASSKAELDAWHPHRGAALGFSQHHCARTDLPRDGVRRSYAHGFLARCHSSDRRLHVARGDERSRHDRDHRSRRDSRTSLPRSRVSRACRSHHRLGGRRLVRTRRCLRAAREHRPQHRVDGCPGPSRARRRWRSRARASGLVDWPQHVEPQALDAIRRASSRRPCTTCCNH